VIHQHQWFFLALMLSAPSFLSCLDVAANRAERDLEIGHSNVDGIRVDVDGGLAAIRQVNDTELHLWASAPGLSFRIERPTTSPSTYRVRIENVLEDAVLTATSTDTSSIPVQIVASPHPTEKTWELTFPTSNSVTLTLRAPDDSLQEPWRFAVYADVQEALGNVEDIYAKMNVTPNIRFALISGDLTQQGTTEQLERFQSSMKTLKFPCFATLGNHELGTRDDLYHDYFGRGNYSFVFRDARFTLLDSASATIEPRVYSWLDGWLSEGQDKLHVVTMHIAPIDPVGARNGSFASRAEADKLLVKLARGGTDLTLYGHVHSFYAFENAAIPAYISGGGGAIPERMDGIGRHFLTVDVEPPGKIQQVAVVRVD
jgi:3',5'-cyclic-AMP phosphodiesterase